MKKVLIITVCILLIAGTAYAMGEKTMELGDIWLKVAMNKQLTPQELDFLRTQGRETQMRNNQFGSVVSADGSIQLTNPILESPTWKGNALQSIEFLGSGAIANATFTEISLNPTYGTSKAFSNLGSSKIRIDTKNNFLVTGLAIFEPHATGDRIVTLRLYDKDGNLLAQYYLASVSAASASNDTVVTFARLIDRKTQEDHYGYFIDSIAIGAYQDSGTGSFDVDVTLGLSEQ